MWDLFISMPGKEFLWVFGFLVLATLVFAWYKGLDDTLRFNLPSMTRFDAVSVATFSGVHNVIRTALFSLWSRNLIRIKKDEESDPILSATASPGHGTNPIEVHILKFLKEDRHSGELFSNKEFKQNIEEAVEPIQNNLTGLNLLKDPEHRDKVWKWAKLLFFLYLILGSLKVYFSVLHDKPFGFLIIEIILGWILIFVFLKPWKTVSDLGARYLKKLKSHFEWVKDSIKKGSIPDGIDPALPIAIFGSGILDGTAPFEAFNEAFKRGDAGSSSGCGGGCGSDSGGGGCGGCGGGGCGGCG